MNNQQQIDHFNEQFQHSLLFELEQYAWLDTWSPQPRLGMQSAQDEALQQEMIAACSGYPFALHLTSKATGNRVWWLVFNNAEDLVQAVLDFANTTTPQFATIVVNAYMHWLKNGRAMRWNPESFLETISQTTYFVWSSTPNFNTLDINAWTPAARQYAELKLQEILYPSTEVASSEYPEFHISQEIAFQFATLNRDSIALLPEALEFNDFLREVRKGRFRTLGLPHVTKFQAYTKGLLLTLCNSPRLLVPDTMVRWAQDLCLVVQGASVQGQQVSADELAAFEVIRSLGGALLDAEYLHPQILNAPFDPPIADPLPASPQQSPPNNPHVPAADMQNQNSPHDADALLIELSSLFG